jgi:pSer/pThr/pTyr-binding forkhead associated (FHA) protein
VVTCPVCRIAYVPNTLFCTECGLYLLKSEDLATDPLETVIVAWGGETVQPPQRDQSVLDSGLLAIRLRINQGDQYRELEIPVTKPVRLGRMDPLQDIYPEVDLTEDMALDYGVSREHACIFRRGEHVVVEDLGSTNGTLLNGDRLAPFLPHQVEDGDQLQLGRLLIEVRFKIYQPQEPLVEEPPPNRDDA